MARSLAFSRPFLSIVNSRSGTHSGVPHMALLSCQFFSQRPTPSRYLSIADLEEELILDSTFLRITARHG